MVVSPPESLPKGTTLIGGKPIYLKVSMLQPTPEGQEPKALPHSSHFSPIQVPSPIKASPPKAEREVSMTMEVEGTSVKCSIRYIWTHVWKLNPKETESHGCAHASAPQIGRSFWSSEHIFPGECPR